MHFFCQIFQGDALGFCIFLQGNIFITRPKGINLPLWGRWHGEAVTDEGGTGFVYVILGRIRNTSSTAQARSPVPVAVPGTLVGANAFLVCRPLPLAQVASSATGGAPIAPPKGEGRFGRRHCIKSRGFRCRNPPLRSWNRTIPSS